MPCSSRLFAIALATRLLLPGTNPAQAAAFTPLQPIPGAQPRNIIFILCDDHRWDAAGYAGHPFLETPNLDRLSRQGVNCSNAFVTTSLCSPSRASILTGLYAHNHRVVDNYNPIPAGLTWFPEYLRQAGYETAFIGKWHMGGDVDDPQPGFDHWLSFKGQGVYAPDPTQLKAKGRFVPQAENHGFNINGKHVPQKGYITDELTDYALAWLKERKAAKPFMLYLSHKAVHADFLPANRHAFRYDKQPFSLPPAPVTDPQLFHDAPRWVLNQRNSRHGVEFAYYSNLDLAKYYRRYCEALLAVDESVGRLLAWLEESGQLDSTLVVYMGDNGFLFGEHGLIDKRNAYEESIRVPLLFHCPDVLPAGRKLKQVVANIDIAPTLLEAAGIQPPHDRMDGRSFWRLAQGVNQPWRDALLYEYYWERNYPQTPTVHAVRGPRYKYIRYHGIWDVDELYDLQQDPHERRNLIRDPEQKERIVDLNRRLFDILEATRGTNLPLLPDRGTQFFLRRQDGTRIAPFPDWFYTDKVGNQ